MRPCTTWAPHNVKDHLAQAIEIATGLELTKEAAIDRAPKTARLSTLRRLSGYALAREDVGIACGAST